MGKFKVLLKGENFLLNVEGREQRLGFYATRFVEAATADEAESAAIELLRADEFLIANVRNKQTDPPDAIRRRNYRSRSPEERRRREHGVHFLHRIKRIRDGNS